MSLKRYCMAMSFAVFALAPGRADFKENYYDAMDGKAREDLKSAAKECVAAHQRLGYTDLPNHWANTDVYPELYENYRGEMCLRFWDMYSDNIYLIFPGQAGKTAFSINKMQREHVVPKSWWKDSSKTDPSNKDFNIEYTPAYSDLWNLFPSDGSANGAKSNYPLGETLSTTFDNGVSKVGVPKEGLGGGAGKVFEPADEYKGDFARVFFYVATVYDDISWATDRYDFAYDRNSWPTLKPWMVDMLLEWSRRDPVSEKEIARNDAVELEQGNRNPYVDFPELAEFVWGARSGQTFYLDEQEGLDPTPPEGASVGVTENDDRLPLGVVDGGFSVLADISGLRVFDISGKVVLFASSAYAGEVFILPRGFYIVTAEGFSEKLKIVVR